MKTSYAAEELADIVRLPGKVVLSIGYASGSQESAGVFLSRAAPVPTSPWKLTVNRMKHREFHTGLPTSSSVRPPKSVDGAAEAVVLVEDRELVPGAEAPTARILGNIGMGSWPEVVTASVGV